MNHKEELFEEINSAGETIYKNYKKTKDLVHSDNYKQEHIIAVEEIKVELSEEISGKPYTVLHALYFKDPDEEYIDCYCIEWKASLRVKKSTMFVQKMYELTTDMQEHLDTHMSKSGERYDKFMKWFKKYRKENKRIKD